MAFATYLAGVITIIGGLVFGISAPNGGLIAICAAIGLSASVLTGIAVKLRLAPAS